jgi:hypothetical protein
MTKELLEFFKSHPLWGILLFVLMVLPILGAIIHIILKALGRPGLTPEPSPEIKSEEDETESQNQ